jgi:lactate dehydrogenase-like 2-hydroxyacid dehydrogenase
VVTNTPGVSAVSVAEHAMALILALTTRTVEGDTFVRRGEFKGWLPLGFWGTDLTGQTLGLIGVGNIGSRVARIAYGGFNTKIIYYDVAVNVEVEQVCAASRCGSVEELLAQADVVSLHVPLLDSTHHLINAERLRLMKPTAILVNTSRGAVIDERALVAALQQRVIRGAGLDVFEFEPELTPGLATLPNVVLTPHIASARAQTRIEMARVAAQGIIDFFAGKVPANQVINH